MPRWSLGHKMWLGANSCEQRKRNKDGTEEDGRLCYKADKCGSSDAWVAYQWCPMPGKNSPGPVFIAALCSVWTVGCHGQGCDLEWDKARGSSAAAQLQTTVTLQLGCKSFLARGRGGSGWTLDIFMPLIYINMNISIKVMSMMVFEKLTFYYFHWGIQKGCVFFLEKWENLQTFWKSLVRLYTPLRILDVSILANGRWHKTIVRTPRGASFHWPALVLQMLQITSRIHYWGKIQLCSIRWKLRNE